MNPETHRQRVLYLWLTNSDLRSQVIAWARYGGPTGAGTQDETEPPYRRGCDALDDGWRLLQSTPVPARTPGHEFVTGRFEYEFVFEQIVPLDAIS